MHECHSLTSSFVKKTFESEIYEDRFFKIFIDMKNKINY